MNTIPEDAELLFEEILKKTAAHQHKMMCELWEIWYHLGLENDTKIQNVHHLYQILADFHEDIASETRSKYKDLQTDIEKLISEAKELGKYLSQEIIIPDATGAKLVQYRDELRQHMERFRDCVRQRQIMIMRLREWQSTLEEQLGVKMQKMQEVPLPSEQNLSDLEKRLKVLQAERDKRAETFLNIQAEVKEIMDKLQISPRNKFEQAVTTSLSVDFKVTDLNMDRLAKLHQDVLEIYDQTNNRVLELREGLIKLWNTLDEDRIYCDNFLQAHQGCDPRTEMAIKQEIQRCNKLKTEKMQVIIADVRTKIKLVWDAIQFSKEQRQEFNAYDIDLANEDILTMHQLYLEKITKFHDDNYKIFNLLQVRKELWAKMSELEARSTDPNRYHNRGGQLLKEEKERKAITLKLPKIENEILELVTKYEQETNQVFTIEGKPLATLIADEWQYKKLEQQSKQSARREALKKRIPKTPDTLRLNMIGGSARVLRSTNISHLKRTAATTLQRPANEKSIARGIRDLKAKRIISYTTDGRKLVSGAAPKFNASILKRKRSLKNERRSSARLSASAVSQKSVKEPLSKSSKIDDYADFKNTIEHNKVTRSTMISSENNKIPIITVSAVKDTYANVIPRKSPLRVGKENIQREGLLTPKKNMLNTPRTRRVALKQNNTPLASVKKSFQ